MEPCHCCGEIAEVFTDEKLCGSCIEQIQKLPRPSRLPFCPGCGSTQDPHDCYYTLGLSKHRMVGGD